MNPSHTYGTYEEFEAALGRELGLSMGFTMLRGAVGALRRRPSATSAFGQSPATAPADFESRYNACKTARERMKFVRENRAEARRFLHLGGHSCIGASNSKPVHRRLK